MTAVRSLSRSPMESGVGDGVADVVVDVDNVVVSLEEKRGSPRGRGIEEHKYCPSC